MEGVVFGVKRGLENFAENGSPVKQLMILGGAAKSVVWSEMIADVTGIPIVRLNQADICAVGAGMIAALGAGWFDSYESAAKAITKVDYLYHPNEANQEYYTRKYAQFRRMWDFMQQYYEENA
jgi:ribulose kinase